MTPGYRHFHSFITRFPIRRSGALQQTFYGSPPACPVLGIPPPCSWKLCKMQVFPDIIHPLLLTPASHSRATCHFTVPIATPAWFLQGCIQSATISPMWLRRYSLKSRVEPYYLLSHSLSYMTAHQPPGHESSAWISGSVTSLLSAKLPVPILPMTREIFYHSTQIRPVVASPKTPMSGATQILLAFRVVYKGRPLHACPEGGIGPYIGVNHFPVGEAADCA